MVARPGGPAAPDRSPWQRAPPRSRRPRGSSPPARSCRPGCAATAPPPSPSCRATSPGSGLDFNAQREAVLANHVDATLALAADVRRAGRPGPTWCCGRRTPATSTRSPPRRRPQLIARRHRAVGVPVLVGAVLDGPRPATIYNTALAVGRRARPRRGVRQAAPGALRRVHPAARRSPGGSPAPSTWCRTTSCGGDRPGCSTSGAAVRLGDLICFEVAYDGMVRDASTGGGRLLVVQTNNATFGRSGETDQQLAMVAAAGGRARPERAGGGHQRHQRGDPPGRQRRRRAHRDLHPRTCSSPSVPLALGRHDRATRVGRAAGARADRCSPSAATGLAWRRTRAARRSAAVTRAGRRPHLQRGREPGPAGRPARAAVPEADVLVVDDASPDGTGELADRLAGGRPAVHVLHRAGQGGPRRGLRRGLRLGARRAATTSVVEMDADGSHAPEELPAAARGAARAPTWCSAPAGCPGERCATGPGAGCCSPAAATPTSGMALGMPLGTPPGASAPTGPRC